VRLGAKKLGEDALDLIDRFRNALRQVRRQSKQDISRFESPIGIDVKADIRNKYGFEGDLLDFFADYQRGALIHKWHHYIPIYDRYLCTYRNCGVRFLEIGVSKGGSLEMWRNYFGPEAVIFGVDIDPSCSEYNNRFAQVRIGSQTDQTFMLDVVEEMGGIDVVLDDGSHNMSDIVSTLRTLFPRLNRPGLYMVEDLHTAYWVKSGGGYRSPANFFNFLRNVIDDMHRWYHEEGVNEKSIGESCTGLHVHDSVVVLERDSVYPPTHSRIP